MFACLLTSDCRVDACEPPAGYRSRQLFIRISPYNSIQNAVTERVSTETTEVYGADISCPRHFQTRQISRDAAEMQDPATISPWHGDSQHHTARRSRLRRIRKYLHVILKNKQLKQVSVCSPRAGGCTSLVTFPRRCATEVVHCFRS